MTKPETKYHNTHQTPPHSRCTPAQQKEVNRINKCGDHYEILGVQRTATKPEIERVFRKVSLKVHPDKNKCPGAEEAFKKLGMLVMLVLIQFNSVMFQPKLEKL